MKIHYLSCHSILEYDEVKLLTDLGHDVFSNGAYLDPAGHISLPRPGIPKAIKWEAMAKLAVDNPKTNLPTDMIEPFDAIIVMHTPEFILGNWERMKHKRVIWRTIGQSTPSVEKRLAKARAEGLQVVRYSPKEELIDGYIGSDVLIRFYKDPGEYCGWIGDTDEVVNFSQSLKGRGAFTHYEHIMGTIAGFNSKVYGEGNDDLGQWNGGRVSYRRQIDIMRKARAYVYGGTWPASYTLSFIEAWMLGLPVVAIGKTLAHLPQFERIDFYEVDELIEDGVNGFVANSIPELREKVTRLLTDYDLAKSISAAGRRAAIDLFGYEKISNQWQKYLTSK